MRFRRTTGAAAPDTGKPTLIGVDDVKTPPWVQVMEAVAGSGIGRTLRAAPAALRVLVRLAWQTSPRKASVSAWLVWHCPLWGHPHPRARWWIVFHDRMAAPVTWEPDTQTPLVILGLADYRPVLIRLAQPASNSYPASRQAGKLVVAVSGGASRCWASDGAGGRAGHRVR
jgi:hypothetical protein